MKYITYLTDKVKEDSKRHGYLEKIEELALKVETEQTDEMFQPYEPSDYRKKRYGIYRLVCYEKTILDCSVYCFLRFYVRGESDYEKFFKDNETVTSELVKYLLLLSLFTFKSLLYFS